MEEGERRWGKNIDQAELTLGPYQVNTGNSERTTPLYCEGNPKVETDNGLAEGDIVDIDADQHWIRHLTFVLVEGIRRGASWRLRFRQPRETHAHSSLRVSQSAFPRADFLDLRWNRPEGANRMIKVLRHALNSRAHLD